MTEDKTIVVTGYGPWAMTAVNPAAQVVEAISETQWSGYRLIPLVVPVQTEGLYRLVETSLQAHRPAIWISFGVAPGATAIRAEVAGLNRRAFEVPDNDGVTLDGVPIVEKGEAAYFSSFPAGDIVAQLRAAGIPAEVSYAAGTHLCNQMLYTALHLIARQGLPTTCGFIHVPYTPEFVAAMDKGDELPPSMSLSLMAAAAKIAIERTIAQLEDAALQGAAE
jgi:pyroglutamyl-peptidase